MATTKLDGILSVKVDKEEMNIFTLKCARMKKDVPDMVREMLTAFNDGRLRIVPTEDQKQQLGELYEH